MATDLPREALYLVQQAEALSSKLRGAEAATALPAFETAYPRFLDALGACIDRRATEAALGMVRALYRFWVTQQRFEEAAPWFDRALALPGGEPALRAEVSVLAGFMPFWLGRDQEAARRFESGLAIARDAGAGATVSQALGGLARVALRSDVAEGRRLAREALGTSEAAEDVAARSNALHLLGVGAQIAGDLEEARAWMTRRLELERAGDNDFLVASEASNLSMVERQLGNLDASERLAREALEISRRTGEAFTRPFAIAALAAIAFERADHARAATLIGAAEAMLDANGMAWPPDEAPHHDRLLAALPDAMGAAAFEAARAAGRTMSTASAMALALG